MDFLLEVNAEGAVGADDFVGADAGVGGDVAIWVGDSDVGWIVTDGELCAGDGGGGEAIEEGGGLELEEKKKREEEGKHGSDLVRHWAEGFGLDVFGFPDQAGRGFRWHRLKSMPPRRCG